MKISDFSNTLVCIESGPVKDLEVVAKSNTSLVVLWNAPSYRNSLVQFYLITFREVRIGNCNTSLGSWSPMTDTDKMEFELTDLHPHSRYQVKVWPQTLAGKGQVLLASGTTEASGRMFFPY